MTITEVRIRRVFEEGTMKAIASVTLNNEFVIHDIKVISTNDGRNFVVMPSRKTNAGTFKDICHPITSETRSYFEEEVLKAYREFMLNPHEEASTTTEE